MSEKKKKSERQITRRDFLKGAAGVAALGMFGSGLMSCDDGSQDFTYRGNPDDNILNGNVSSTIALPGKTIVSPYAGVNWETYGQYKSALHTHTTRSDGANTLEQMIEEKYRQNYDIVAITDHNITNENWTTGLGRLPAARYSAMADGTAPILNLGGNLASSPRGKGILRLRHCNEQSRTDHLNTFFTEWNNTTGATLATSILRAEEADGISFINHIGRYTHRNASDEAERIAASNNSIHINKYVDLFMAYPSCVGLEIINRRDRETYSDRILWDNILKITAPQGRTPWGFSTDDAHSNAPSENGNSYSMLLMPSLNGDYAKSAMQNGHHYAVAKVSRLELGEAFYGLDHLPPTIKSIAVNADGITITTENVTRIDWISDGEVIGSTTAADSSFDLSKVGSYLRANLRGPGGIAFTQPFRIS